MSHSFRRGSLAAFIALAIGVGVPAFAQDGAQRGDRSRALLDRARTQRAEASDPLPTPIAAAGTYRFHFDHDGIRRSYIVYVPARAVGRPAPMILALHGGGGDMDQMMESYGLTRKADEAGFIAVFPNGYSRWPSGLLATWNADSCCGGAAARDIDDVGFLAEVIARVSRQVPIDPRRIYATGMSNGAMMSYRLACELSQTIRAIAAVAGTDGNSRCTPARPVPVIHFHARDDSHVLFTGGAGPDALARTHFRSVPATIGRWVGLNRAQAPAQTVLEVPGASCVRHAGPAPVELCVTEGGGHSWPGSTSRRANKTPSQAISANDRMWAFFSALGG